MSDWHSLSPEVPSRPAITALAAYCSTPPPIGKHIFGNCWSTVNFFTFERKWACFPSRISLRPCSSSISHFTASVLCSATAEQGKDRTKDDERGLFPWQQAPTGQTGHSNTATQQHSDSTSFKAYSHNNRQTHTVLQGGYLPADTPCRPRLPWTAQKHMPPTDFLIYQVLQIQKKNRIKLAICYEKFLIPSRIAIGRCEIAFYCKNRASSLAQITQISLPLWSKCKRTTCWNGGPTAVFIPHKLFSLLRTAQLQILCGMLLSLYIILKHELV